MYSKYVNNHVIILGLWFYFLRIGLEAHGGYTFCGYAALAILGQEQKADAKKLLVKFDIWFKSGNLRLLNLLTFSATAWLAFASKFFNIRNAAFSWFDDYQNYEKWPVDQIY